jgi:tetratricopeptide (TPR) repeat protein
LYPDGQQPYFNGLLGEKHPHYAMSLVRLAGLYQAQGNYAKAEPLYVEALSIWKQAPGDKHPDYARSLNDMAVLYGNQAKYANAESVFVEALAIGKQLLGDKHPEYARVLDNLAYCELGLHSFDAAATHASQAIGIIRRHLDLTSAIQSEHQQLLMVNSWRGGFDAFLSYCRAAKSSPESVYDQVLVWKGIVTGRQTFLRTMRRALASQPELAKLFSDLESATRELTVLTNLVPNPRVLCRP